MDIQDRIKDFLFNVVETVEEAYKFWWTWGGLVYEWENRFLVFLVHLFNIFSIIILAVVLSYFVGFWSFTGIIEREADRAKKQEIQSTRKDVRPTR